MGFISSCNNYLKRLAFFGLGYSAMKLGIGISVSWWFMGLALWGLEFIVYQLRETRVQGSQRFYEGRG